MQAILDTILFHIGEYAFTVDSLLSIIAVLILARSLVYLVGSMIETYFARNELNIDSIDSILRLMRYTLYFFSLLIALNIIRLDYSPLMETELFTIRDKFSFTLGKLITLIVILVLARLISYIFNPIIRQYLKGKKVDPGREYAIITFLRYTLYTLSILIGFYVIDLKITLVWSGIVGLLVGIGLGLQQTFNDWFSGLLILLEASVEVGDVIYFKEDVVKVKSIGIRSSKVENRDGVVIIVPNSKLVVNSVVNWSNNHAPTRFDVRVGVSYGSDVKLVTNILLEVAEDHLSVLKEPPPVVFFNDFGSSSLDFILYFYSNDFFYIEKVKSELRYRITEKFRENKVEIPFPQRDIWIRSSGPQES